MKRFLKGLCAVAKGDSSRTTALRERIRARLQVERLEDRMVPTVQAFPVVGGVLTVNGDQLFLPTNDVIAVATSPAGGVSVTLNNENVTFAPGQVNSIVINPGGSFNGYNHISIQATNVPVTINDSDPRGDSVVIGQNANLQGIHAPVALQNSSFNTSLTVDDVADPSYRNISISATDVKVSGVPDISFQGLYLYQLTVAAGGPRADIQGDGGNYIGISGIAGELIQPRQPPSPPRPNGTLVAVYTGFGNNTIVAGPNLDAFRGWLSVNGQGLSNYFDIDDSGNAGARNYDLETSTFSSSGMPDYLSFHSIDRLYVTGAAGPDTFTVGSAPLTALTFLNGGAGNMNTLAGPIATVDWFVSGPFHGSLAFNGAPTNVHFDNMQNLHGNTGVDTFQFAVGGLVRSIDGGGGDWLDYSMFDNTHPVAVNLTNGTATNVLGSIAHIQNVLGGDGGDWLIGGSGGNILIGGMGSNTLVGGPDGNLLIGGPGAANTLTAGAFGDILIGGYTDYDSNSDAHRAALQSILNEWRTDSSNLRIARLTGPGFYSQGVNGQNYLNASTVHDNLAADTLNAGMALDWIFRHQGFFGGYSDIVNAPPNNNDVFFYY